MIFNPEDPNTWPCFRPLMIAHDVGRSRDRSTAVIGGNSPVQPRLLGIKEFHELPQGLFASARASALATIDRRHNSNALIIADLSYDPSYAEVLFEAFGWRVIGIHIGPHGDGMNVERRPVKNGSIPIYTIGRSYLFELLHSGLQSNQVRFVNGPMSVRAYAQLNGLETELRENGIIYKCPPGQHDDLAMSCAMLAWASQHPHLTSWVGTASAARRPRKPREKFNWGAVT